MPTIVLSDDARLAYREQGAGRPLLLVHGWAAHGGFFQPQLEGLSSAFRVISVDLRGHGESPNSADAPLNTERLGADVTELLDRLDLSGVTAVGWSLGAMVLWEACLSTAAGRIERLVIEDMSPRIVNEAGWALGLRGGYDAAALRRDADAMVEDWPARAAVTARSMVSSRVRRDKLVRWAEGEIAAQDPAPLAQLWRSLEGADYRNRLAAVRQPTLIVQGRYSPYRPETARYLERALPNAAALFFERSGHTPHLEEPELFNRVVSEFADQPPGRASAPAGLATSTA